MFKDLTDEADVIEKTQKTAFELSSILKSFNQIISEQESMSFNILKDTESSVEMMKVANKHLSSANERSKGMEVVWVIYFITMTAVLIFYDWWTARVVYVAD